MSIPATKSTDTDWHQANAAVVAQKQSQTKTTQTKTTQTRTTEAAINTFRQLPTKSVPTTNKITHAAPNLDLNEVAEQKAKQAKQSTGPNFDLNEVAEQKAKQARKQQNQDCCSLL